MARYGGTRMRPKRNVSRQKRIAGRGGQGPANTFRRAGVGGASRVVGKPNSNRIVASRSLQGGRNPNAGNRGNGGSAGKPSGVPQNYRLLKKRTTVEGRKKYEEYWCPGNTITQDCKKGTQDVKTNYIAHTGRIRRGRR